MQNQWVMQGWPHFALKSCLNNKVKVTTRKSYGFRTFKAVEVALYHSIGDLPESECTHRFC